MASSVLAWFLAAGGQGLHLSNRQVHRARRQPRQGPADSIRPRIRHALGHRYRQRYRTTGVRTGPAEGDRARTRPLRHPRVPHHPKPLTRRPPIRSRQLPPRRRRRRRRRASRRRSRHSPRNASGRPHPRIHPHQSRPPITDLRIRLNRRRQQLDRVPRSLRQSRPVYQGVGSHRISTGGPTRASRRPTRGHRRCRRPAASTGTVHRRNGATILRPFVRTPSQSQRASQHTHSQGACDTTATRQTGQGTSHQEAPPQSRREQSPGTPRAPPTHGKKNPPARETPCTPNNFLRGV